ncbi:MAG: hypothetical protein HFG54_13260 [Lachnospiraceae bacterium]|jgi:hypothetical protein|nr:hypothetical protein [Lachnospiraceae bacterium]
MATRLIIEGNAVYEIDEDCQEYQRKRNGARNRGRCRECGGTDYIEGAGRVNARVQEKSI